LKAFINILLTRIPLSLSSFPPIKLPSPYAGISPLLPNLLLLLLLLLIIPPPILYPNIRTYLAVY